MKLWHCVLYKYSQLIIIAPFLLNVSFPVLLHYPSAVDRNHPLCSGLTGANMAAEGDVDLDLEADENCTGKPAEKPRKHDSGAADLERVTDYAEEKEISSSDLETVRNQADAS